MITPEKVQTMIKGKFPDAEVKVVGDGQHFEAIIVSDEFAGKTKVKQHQMVYSAVNEAMKSEIIHALSLKTFTPEAWKTFSS